VSDVGKVLDPTVDRIVLVSAVLALALDHVLPLWLCVLIVIREATVVATGATLVALGATRVDVIWLGKAGTFGLMASYPLLLLGHGSGSAAHLVGDVGAAIFVPSLVVSFAAALAYIPSARRALAAGRSSLGSHA
jgi:cardiolipin synthase